MFRNNKNIRRHVLLFICQARYCPNLRVNKQIPSDLQLSKVTPKVIWMLMFRCRKKFDNSFYFKILGIV